MRSARTNCSLTVEFSLVQENILIQNERITQLYIIQSEKDPYLWFGVLFVDTGIYKGAVVRFNMIIDQSYPDCSCPKIIFEPVPYHPLVNPETGELDTKYAFSDWSSSTHKLHQLLSFVKRVIFHAETYVKQIQKLLCDQVVMPPPDYDINDLQQIRSQKKLVTPFEDAHEAQVDNHAIQDSKAFNQTLVDLFTCFEHTVNCIWIYENRPEEFQRRVEEFKKNCCHQLFDRPKSCGDDKNVLLFTPWDEALHETIRSSVLAGRLTPSSLFASYHKETDSVSFVPGTDQ